MEIGRLVKERYRIMAVLGKGGMGAVYRAVDETLGVQVALKENLFEEEEYVRQFRREATILANLRHPNLPRVTDHFVIDGQGQYLVMDYIEGEDLKDRIDRLGVIHVREALAMGATICGALDYLHNRPQPILHRDIKPGNVKITPNGEVFLVDFGLAKIVSGSGQTTIGAQGITPGFSSPEQYGTTPTTALSDIYSLAATLYVAVSGSPPENALARMMDENVFTDVRERNPTVPEAFAAALNHALEIHPENRYQSASEFRQALLEVSDTMQADIDAGEVEVDAQAFGEATTIRKEEMPIEQPERLAAESRDKKGVVPLKWVLPAAVILLAVAGWFIRPYFAGGGNEDASAPTSAASTLEQADPGSGGGGTAPSARPTATMHTTEIPAANNPTPAPTTIGGGNGTIAFASDRTGIPQIWVIHVDGSGLRQVTDIPSGACQPDWSPDGQQMVFVSPCPRNQDRYPGSSLFLVNADGSGLTPLPAFPGGDFDPAWSPDGIKIAFTSIRDGGREQIWTLDMSSNETANLSNSVAKDFQPEWSPDGKTIMFVTTRSGTEQLWFMDASGRPWDFFTRSEEYNNRDPVWSPDGETIFFTQSRPSGGSTWLSAANWEGGGVLRGFDEYFIMADAAERAKNTMREADISPDGLWLVVMNNPGSTNRDIYIMAISGSSLTRLTEHAGIDFDPVWNPAG